MSIYYISNAVEDHFKLLTTSIEPDKVIGSITNDKNMIKLTILTPITSTEFTDISKRIMTVLNEKLIIYYHSACGTIKMKQTPLELQYH